MTPVRLTTDTYRSEASLLRPFRPLAFTFKTPCFSHSFHTLPHYVPLTKKPGFSQPERALFAQSINNRRALRAEHSDFTQAFLSLHLPPRLPHQNYKLSFTPFTYCTFDFVDIFDLGRAILAILTSG